MALTYSHWQPLSTQSAAQSPYVRWFEQMESQLKELPLCAGMSIYPRRNAAAAAGHATGFSEQLSAQLKAHYGSHIPIPNGVAPAAMNQVSAPEMVIKSLGQAVPEAAPLQKDSVFTAVVDSGISPLHAQLIGENGPRVLWYWNQDAPASPARFTGRDRRNTPFGQEHFWQDLVDAQEAAKGDEAKLQTLLGLADFARPAADRACALRSSHGTHILGLAGAKRRSDTGNFAEKNPLLAVNLPRAIVQDTSGRFLEFYLIHAVQRCLDVADALWEARFGSDVNAEGKRGFKMMINLSFALSAGPKNGRMLLERYLGGLAAERGADWQVPEVFLPAGNDNMDQLTAHFSMASGEVQHIGWRLQPDDRTSSYLEIWGAEQSLDAPFPDLAISLSAPMEQAEIAPLPPRPSTRDICHNGRKIGQISTGVLASSDATKCRPYVHVALSPSQPLPQDVAAAPSGLWTLTLCNQSTWSTECEAYVQRDDAIGSVHQRGRQSYFEHPEMVYATPMGTPMAEDAPQAGPIRHRGSVNAIASHLAEHLHVVAGFEVKRQRLVPYCGAAPGFQGAVDQGVKVLPQAYPCAQSPMRDGFRAAGSQSGGAASRYGTSVASALAAGSAARLALGATPEAPSELRDRDGNAQGAGSTKTQGYGSEITLCLGGTSDERVTD
jgi:hypothetical protein